MSVTKPDSTRSVGHRFHRPAFLRRQKRNGLCVHPSWQKPKKPLAVSANGQRAPTCVMAASVSSASNVNTGKPRSWCNRSEPGGFQGWARSQVTTPFGSSMPGHWPSGENEVSRFVALPPQSSSPLTFPESRSENSTCLARDKKQSVEFVIQSSVIMLDVLHDKNC
jgi:hypothetical protein